MNDLWFERMGDFTIWLTLRGRGKSDFRADREAVIDVALSARPDYCDRGRWKMTVHGMGLHIDDADSFPRYYFDLGRAKLEVEDWMRARGLTPEFWDGECLP